MTLGGCEGACRRHPGRDHISFSSLHHFLLTLCPHLSLPPLRADMPQAHQVLFHPLCQRYHWMPGGLFVAGEPASSKPPGNSRGVIKHTDSKVRCLTCKSGKMGEKKHLEERKTLGLGFDHFEFVTPHRTSMGFGLVFRVRPEEAVQIQEYAIVRTPGEQTHLLGSACPLTPGLHAPFSLCSTSSQHPVGGWLHLPGLDQVPSSTHRDLRPQANTLPFPRPL